MEDFLAHLRDLMAAPGIPGGESGVRDALAEAWMPLVDELQVSSPGSLYALKEGLDSARRPVLMLAAHMDSVGLVVTGEREGLLQVAAAGNFDPRQLPGQLVTVHGRSPIPGVVALPSPPLLPAEVQEGPVPAKHMLVDTGLPASELAQKVKVGDAITFEASPVRLGGGELAGPTLDNRASLAALTTLLWDLKDRQPPGDVWLAATVQEELTLLGAPTSAHALRPDLALIVDVTFARDGISPSHAAYPQGAGPTLAWGAANHPLIFQDLQALADRSGLPCQVEIIPATSGTDADAIQLAAGGIPTLLVSIPIRYMHTPVEVVRIEDIHSTARLLAEFIAWLPEDYAERLVWDD